MNAMDLFDWLRDAVWPTSEAGPASRESVDGDRAARLAAAARDERLTSAILTDHDGIYACQPPLSYLQEGEQPEYVFQGGRVWFGDDPSVRGDEIPTRQTLVFVTDRRIVLVVGKQLTDELWGIPHGDVETVTVRYSDSEAYFVFRAIHEEEPATTLVELLEPSTPDRYREVVRYCNDRAGADPPSEDDDQ